MQLPQKQKKISEFFSRFFKSILDFKIFQKKMSLTADVFLKLRTPKTVVW